MVLLNENKLVKKPRKLQMYWLGPYIIHFMTDGGVVQLQQLDGVLLPKIVNRSRLNPYRDNQM